VAVTYLTRLHDELRSVRNEEDFTLVLSETSRLKLLREVAIPEEDEDDEDEDADADDGGEGSSSSGGGKGSSSGRAQQQQHHHVGSEDVVVIHLRLGDVLENGFGEPR
jgi:hypothetical protein